MEDKPNAPMRQAFAKRGTRAVTQTKINDGGREVRMAG
jgi:hypothetical protein